MPAFFPLIDTLALEDLTTYLSRAARVEDGSVRLIAGSGVLAAYTAILYPRGLLDGTPTVLGLRTFALTEPVEFDAVVPSRSLLDRLARASSAGTTAVAVPHEVGSVTWAGISPPRGGWVTQGSTDAATLESVAHAGIAEIAAAVPTGTGEQLVQRARAEVWSRPIDGLDYVPAGAAFAAMSLGFLAADDPVNVLETGPWTRLSTRRGHVLVRRKAWSLRG
ncbi:hypothetical protein WDJ51_00115 [Rathayibacter sp. YIM 133350]|uniref:hypothetical protein n=1 Tax=Rathayibacter sp. YIM 133350 TaxID=3131992 RepID=UPI00307DB287